MYVFFNIKPMFIERAYKYFKNIFRKQKPHRIHGYKQFSKKICRSNVFFTMFLKILTFFPHFLIKLITTLMARLGKAYKHHTLINLCLNYLWLVGLLLRATAATTLCNLILVLKINVHDVCLVDQSQKTSCNMIDQSQKTCPGPVQEYRLIGQKLNYSNF